MFNLVYVTWDEVNQSYTDDWARLNGVPLTAERALAEVREIPRGALVVDWDFCLDRDQFDALIAQVAGKTVLAVHGYTLDDGERQRLRSKGVVVCRYQAEALAAVRGALSRAA